VLVGCGWSCSAVTWQSGYDGVRETCHDGGVLRLTLRCTRDDQSDEDEATAYLKCAGRLCVRSAHRRVAIRARGLSTTRSWTRLAGKQQGGGPELNRGSTVMHS
jgi:hypothetical protein